MTGRFWKVTVMKSSPAPSTMQEIQFSLEVKTTLVAYGDDRTHAELFYRLQTDHLTKDF